ncbi:hypothetical protein TGAMA5MH_10235 [Trichoderma gamsii]|uniref:Uncharacterized protein n=1 Tax=Trichoderma gamsii TaxID=398673 RepID=A0A2K0SXB0_9HYPO|nr:hypothetical protein TGAMA5MH_10235 [Trichoderma gamsii]
MPRKAASANSAPGLASSAWDKVDFLNDLLVAFYQAGNHTNSFNPQVNTAIVEFLTSRGYDTSWSAIRSPSTPKHHQPCLLLVKS